MHLMASPNHYLHDAPHEIRATHSSGLHIINSKTVLHLSISRHIKLITLISHNPLIQPSYIRSVGVHNCFQAFIFNWQITEQMCLISFYFLFLLMIISTADHLPQQSQDTTKIEILAVLLLKIKFCVVEREGGPQQGSRQHNRWC